MESKQAVISWLHARISLTVLAGINCYSLVQKLFSEGQLNARHGPKQRSRRKEVAILNNHVPFFQELYNLIGNRKKKRTKQDN